MLAGLQSQNRGGWSWHIWNSFGRGQSSNALCFSCFQTYLAMQAVAGEGRGQPFWVPWASLQGKPYLSRWVFLYISSVTWKVEIITWKFKKKGRKKGTREGRVQRGECATTERSLARNQETKCSWTQSSAWVNLRAKNTIQWSKKKKKKRAFSLQSNTQGSRSHHIHFSQKSLYILPSLISGMQRALLIQRELLLMERFMGFCRDRAGSLQAWSSPSLTCSLLLPLWDASPLPEGARSPGVFSCPQRRNTCWGWNCVLAQSPCHAQPCRPYRLQLPAGLAWASCPSVWPSESARSGNEFKTLGTHPGQLIWSRCPEGPESTWGEKGAQEKMSIKMQADIIYATCKIKRVQTDLLIIPTPKTCLPSLSLLPWWMSLHPQSCLSLFPSISLHIPFLSICHPTYPILPQVLVIVCP